MQYENLRYTLKLNGNEVQTERKMNNPDRERKSKRFFASDLIKVDNETKNTFLEAFSLKDAIKLNKQDPIVQNAILPVLPENPVQNNRNIKEKEKEKEKEKIDKLIGREVKKKFQHHGYFIGKVTAFDDPYYKIIYEDGDEEEMTRGSVLKYLVDLKNDNVKEGLRKKRKEVLIGGQIHFF